MTTVEAILIAPFNLVAFRQSFFTIFFLFIDIVFLE